MISELRIIQTYEHPRFLGGEGGGVVTLRFYCIFITSHIADKQ